MRPNELVLPTYTGALDFSQCIDNYFYEAGKSLVDSVINLTGFALVGGPATQDHPRAIAALKKLNRPYLCAVPATFQTFEEWKDSELGLHPIQVALQVALPELDGAIEPIIVVGRDFHCSATRANNLKSAGLRSQVRDGRVRVQL